MSKIVIFGGDGFIGRNLIKGLSEKNINDEIFVFDRFLQYKIGSGHPFDKYSNVSIIPGDFFNRSDLDDVLEGADFVFHLISTTNPASSNNDPFVDIDTNIRGSVELFQACVEKNIKKLIFLSSGGTVYGDIDHDKINEESLPSPRSPYGIGKLTIENYLRYFKYTHGLNYIIYRVANPYGHGQNIHGNQGVIPIFINHALSDDPITIFGDGSMQRDYIYIDDLTSMITGSYDKPNIFDAYNIGSGNGTCVNELVKTVEKCSGLTLKKNYMDTPATYVQNSVLDITRFVNEFNIYPQISLNIGIERTWNYVKSIR